MTVMMSSLTTSLSTKVASSRISTRPSTLLRKLMTRRTRSLRTGLTKRRSLTQTPRSRMTGTKMHPTRLRTTKLKSQRVGSMTSQRPSLIPVCLHKCMWHTLDLMYSVDAEKPEEWDDEEDGEWIAPTVRNSKCEEAPGCGTWKR